MFSKAKAGLAVLGLASALAFSGPAAAQDMGFYIGGAIGQAEANGACDGISGPGISCDEKDTAWKVLGGYQFNRNLAVELGYANLGEVSASGAGTTVTAEATAWDLVAVGSLPLMDQLSVYGKIGLFRADVELSSNVPGVSGDDSESGLTFGVGLRFDVMRNLGLRLEWQRYQEIDDDTDVDVLSLGVIWRF
jgi:OOP family OmpA-OmpF porin